MRDGEDDEGGEASPGTVLDRESIDHDIVAGAKAYKQLVKNAEEDWTRWSAIILGLRGLRSLAFEKAGTNNMQSQSYRNAMKGLLTLRKYMIYDQIDKQVRSVCYSLMDNLEQIDSWYSSLSKDEQLRWKHPASIVKHCPRHLVRGGMRGHNNPPRPAPRRPAVSVETERLKALLIQVIKRLARYEPAALDLLDQLHLSAAEDRVDDLFTREQAS
jgi:hypothetical protein